MDSLPAETSVRSETRRTRDAVGAGETEGHHRTGGIWEGQPGSFRPPTKIHSGGRSSKAAASTDRWRRRELDGGPVRSISSLALEGGFAGGAEGLSIDLNQELDASLENEAKVRKVKWRKDGEGGTEGEQMTEKTGSK